MKMNKVIAIGQSALDIIHVDGKPIKSLTGGRIANMAASLGRVGVDVRFVSECANDCVGDLIVEFLNENNVVTASVDRFTEGKSEISLLFRDDAGNERYIEYEQYPEDRFDVLWPKIEENDILVFGSYISIEEKVRPHLLELLEYARDRKAVIIYLPGFRKELCNRITRVMPAILENLELADVVIARESDMSYIFGKDDSRSCYNEHILFYCSNFLYSDSDNRLQLHTPSGVFSADASGAVAKNKLGWDSSVCAGFVYGLLRKGITAAGIDSADADVWKEALRYAELFAADTLRSGYNVVSEEFASEIKKQDNR